MVPPSSFATLSNLPFDHAHLGWSQLVCQAVNTVLQAVHSLNIDAQQRSALAFRLHRIQENGFIFTLSRGAGPNEGRTLLLLKLREVVLPRPRLQLGLYELSPSGELSQNTEMTNSLIPHLQKYLQGTLLSEYERWKGASFTGKQVLPTSETVH